MWSLCPWLPEHNELGGLAGSGAGELKSPAAPSAELLSYKSRIQKQQEELRHNLEEKKRRYEEEMKRQMDDEIAAYEQDLELQKQRFEVSKALLELGKEHVDSAWGPLPASQPT